MCGIVALVGSRPAAPQLLEGLRQLEYRGYDSAGLAVVDAADELPHRRQSGPRRRSDAQSRQERQCGVKIIFRLNKTRVRLI